MELANPTSSAPARSGPERGQTNQPGLGRRTPDELPGAPRLGSTRSAQLVAAAAISANSSQAARQSAPAARANGAATATPQPVPELMADSTRPRRAIGSRPATTSENGGKTRPALAPATRSAANRTDGFSATPARPIPATAHTPPAPTIARAPRRADNTPAVTDMTRYAMYDAAASRPSAPLLKPNSARM